MAKNPLANMLAQAATPGPVTATTGKKVALPKGVQKNAPPAAPIGKNPPAPPKAGAKGKVPPQFQKKV